MTNINRERLLSYINRMDSKLEGYTKKIDLYCIGGTALTLCRKKSLSHDMDFIVSREDFVTVSSITAEIEDKDKIRIDLMPEGEHVDYFLHPDYQACAKKIGAFKNLNLYVLSDRDVLLMKALAGRPKDYGDITELAKKIKKDDLIKRFNQLKFKKGRKEKLAKKLAKFIKRIDI